jgi:hypothetical protein
MRLISYKPIQFGKIYFNNHCFGLIYSKSEIVENWLIILDSLYEWYLKKLKKREKNDISIISLDKY